MGYVTVCFIAWELDSKLLCLINNQNIFLRILDHKIIKSTTTQFDVWLPIDNYI
jgi:hypothetical protein